MRIVLPLLLAASVAHADASTAAEPTALFADSGLAYLDDPIPARAAVGKVVGECKFSPYSRIGPSPSQRARCNQAVEAAIAHGPDGALAALEALDRKRGADFRPNRVYDVVARVGDAATIAPLVAALEKIARTRPARSFEASAIVHTLESVSYAQVATTAPWDAAGDPVEQAVRWRTWLDAHRGRTRAQLLDERIADARAHKLDADSGTSFVAANFLAHQPLTAVEGRDALRALAARAGLSPVVRGWIENAQRETPFLRNSASPERRV
jgi:hypothetical protein